MDIEWPVESKEGGDRKYKKRQHWVKECVIHEVGNKQIDNLIILNKWIVI